MVLPSQSHSQSHSHQPHSYFLRRKRPGKGAYWLEDDPASSDDSDWYPDKEDTMELKHIRELGRRYRASSFSGQSSPGPYRSPEPSSHPGPRSAPVAITSQKTKVPGELQLSPDEKKYLQGMSPEEKTRMYQQYTSLTDTTTHPTPFRFKLLSLPSSVLSDASKRYLLHRFAYYQSMNPDHGEYSKYAKWFDCLQRIPFGIYHRFNHQTPDTIGTHLTTIRRHLDASVAEHNTTKNQLMLLLAQWMTNPEAKGKCIGIQGPAGIGKTTLIKQGVCQTLQIPFGFIPLGGAGDASFLEGHAFTYEGGTYGRIVELLIKLQVMNPILFFDELDKIADSPKGEEVAAILTHLTDDSQNHHFTDKYLGDVELDMSRCLMVFTFNDETKLHPILKDRLHILRLEGYTREQKINIALHHLIPKIQVEYHWPKENVQIRESVLRTILSLLPEEAGVRSLKRALETIFGWINMAQYVLVPPLTELLTFPFVLEESHLASFMP